MKVLVCAIKIFRYFLNISFFFILCDNRPKSKGYIPRIQNLSVHLESTTIDEYKPHFSIRSHSHSMKLNHPRRNTKDRRIQFEDLASICEYLNIYAPHLQLSPSPVPHQRRHREFSLNLKAGS